MSILRSTDWNAANYDEVKEVEVAPWSAPPVTLIGDAAHAMSPNLGQGANAAMVDGLVLARLLVEDRAGEFEAIRRPFVTKVQRTARRMSEVSRWTWAPARAFRDLVVRLRGSGAGALRLAAGWNPADQPFFSEKMI